MKVLEKPLVFAAPAVRPMKTLPAAALDCPAFLPIKTLPLALLTVPAFAPISTLSTPVVLAAPAPSPAKTLLPVAVPSWPLELTKIAVPPDEVAPLTPAMNVALCVVPMRIVLDSAATPGLPMSILKLPVVRFAPAPSPSAMFVPPVF